MICGSPDRHFEVPLWLLGDDKKMISRGCPSLVFCRNGVDVERFRAFQISFSPYVNARGSFSVSQHLLEDCRWGVRGPCVCVLGMVEVFEVGESNSAPRYLLCHVL